MADANMPERDAPSAADFMIRQESIIETFGYSVIMTWDDDNQPFCYTVGRAQNDLPELILFGMMEEGKSIINDVAPLIHGDATDSFYQQPDWNMPMFVGDASNVGEYARFAFGRQAKINPESPVRVMQIVIPDINGRMPWEQDCDPRFIALQPLHIQRPQSRRAH